MALKHVEPEEIKIRGNLSRKTYLARTFYLGQRRNAWHSTWSNTYSRGSISFDIAELKSNAEKSRIQGSIFKIASVPMLVLRYAGGSFGILPINERSKWEYDCLLREIEENPLSKFWNHLPPSSENWILVFDLTGEEPKAEKYKAVAFESRSKGPDCYLDWNQQEGNEFETFFGFASAIAKQLNRARTKTLRHSKCD